MFYFLAYLRDKLMQAGGTQGDWRNVSLLRREHLYAKDLFSTIDWTILYNFFSHYIIVTNSIISGGAKKWHNFWWSVNFVYLIRNAWNFIPLYFNIFRVHVRNFKDIGQKMWKWQLIKNCMSEKPISWMWGFCMCVVCFTKRFTQRVSGVNLYC